MRTTVIKSILLLTCAILLLVPTVPVFASAESDTIKFPVLFQFEDIDRCTGRTLSVVVSGKMTVHTTFTESTTHVNTTLVWSATSTEVESGLPATTDHGIMKELMNLTPHNRVSSYHFTASGKYADGSPWHVTIVVHQTLNANGDIKVDFSHTNLNCP